MKSDPLGNNRKALMSLLLCTGFIALHPLAVMAESTQATVHGMQQQKKSVSGIIKDAKGEPIIGASIAEKGTTNGTITDLDGKFSLNVAPEAVLQITYIGFKTQEIPATPGKQMNVTLQEDTETLDEVVVVGYGVQKSRMSQVL